MTHYDVIVVGGGPGGYVAAGEASKLGKKVALIEADELGGTCLNRGCIPSKTLLRHAEIIEQIEQAKHWGIETGEVRFSLDKMMKRKNEVIERLRQGVAFLLKTGKIDHYKGFGTVHKDRTVTVQHADQTERIRAEHIILATGSQPVLPPIPGIEQVAVHTSDTIFDLDEIPQSLTIIGGGVIGVELACVFASLDVPVTIVEMAERLIPGEDPDAVNVLTKALEKKNIRIHTGAKVTALKTGDTGHDVMIETKNGDQQVISAEHILVSVGRGPNVSGISELGLKMDGPFVAVNRKLETSVPNIYAVGDLIGGWQLAHAASAEGIVAARNTAGKNESFDDRVVPRGVYTHPEIASVGLTEAEAVAKGYAVRAETFHLANNGKALALGEREGFAKIIAEEQYGEILGVVMVGPHVTEMISEASAFMYLEGTVEEMATMIHPHPTVTETLYEAAVAWMGQYTRKNRR